MTLDDLKKGSKLLLTIVEPGKGGSEQLCTFMHCDGMYSLILTPAGDAVHLGRRTPVRPVKDYWVVDTKA